MVDLGADHALYSISVTSESTGVNPQMLRVYEQKGLLAPYRTQGGTRRYSGQDVDTIAEITTLLAAGLNLAGIEQVLQLRAETQRLQGELDRLRARAPQPPANAQKPWSDETGDPMSEFALVSRHPDALDGSTEIRVVGPITRTTTPDCATTFAASSRLARPHPQPVPCHRVRLDLSRCTNISVDGMLALSVAQHAAAAADETSTLSTSHSRSSDNSDNTTSTTSCSTRRRTSIEILGAS